MRINGEAVLSNRGVGYEPPTGASPRQTNQNPPCQAYARACYGSGRGETMVRNRRMPAEKKKMRARACARVRARGI